MLYQGFSQPRTVLFRRSTLPLSDAIYAPVLCSLLHSMHNRSLWLVVI